MNVPFLEVTKDFEQPCLVVRITAYGRESWNSMILKVPSHPNHSVIAATVGHLARLIVQNVYKHLN